MKDLSSKVLFFFLLRGKVVLTDFPSPLLTCAIATHDALAEEVPSRGESSFSVLLTLGHDVFQRFSLAV